MQHSCRDRSPPRISQRARCSGGGDLLTRTRCFVSGSRPRGARRGPRPRPALRKTWYNNSMVDTEISRIPLFAQITEKAAAIVASGGVTDVRAGHVLVQAGDAGVGMFVVLDGSVVVERGDLHIEIGREGFFGELSLLVPDSPRIARVRAKTDARLLAVPRPTFDFLLATEPPFARELLRELASRLVLARSGH